MSSVSSKTLSEASPIITKLCLHCGCMPVTNGVGAATGDAASCGRGGGGGGTTPVGGQSKKSALAANIAIATANTDTHPTTRHQMGERVM